MNEEGGRQTGRTYRQLERLPDRSIFLVHCGSMATYCRGLLRKMGRDPRAIRFATPDDFRRFEGYRAPAVAIDHAYFGFHRARSREAADFICACAA